MKNKIIIIIIIILSLTGCYDQKELNNIAILSATEINKVNNEYIVSAEVVNPQSPDQSTHIEAPFIIYTGKGKTIQDAYRMIKLSSSRYLYPDHLQVLIINEKIAKEDITEILDFFLRDPSIRTEFYVIIGKNDNILDITTPIDNISSTSIVETLKTNNNFLGVANLVTLNEMTIMSLNPNTEIILPSIELPTQTKEDDSLKNTEDTKVDSMFKLSGLSVFKDNKLIGYLNYDESISYNLIKNNVKNSILTYECEPNKYLTIEAINSNSKIKVKNNKINIFINIEAAINESNCNIHLNNNNDLRNLENNLKTYLDNKLTTNINNIRNKYNSDIFGFLDEIYKHDYNNYKHLSTTWYNSTYKTIPININSKINIIGKGNVMEGINEKN